MSAVQLAHFSEGRERLRQSFLMSCFCSFDNLEAISADLTCGLFCISPFTFRFALMSQCSSQNSFSQKTPDLPHSDCSHLVLLSHLDLNPLYLIFDLLAYSSVSWPVTLHLLQFVVAFCSTRSGSVGVGDLQLGNEVILSCSFAFVFEALGDQIIFVNRPDKKKILFYNDKSCHFAVDEGRCWFT